MVWPEGLCPSLCSIEKIWKMKANYQKKKRKDFLKKNEGKIWKTWMKKAYIVTTVLWYGPSLAMIIFPKAQVHGQSSYRYKFQDHELDSFQNFLRNCAWTCYRNRKDAWTMKNNAKAHGCEVWVATGAKIEKLSLLINDYVLRRGDDTELIACLHWGVLLYEIVRTARFFLPKLIGNAWHVKYTSTMTT